MKAIKPKTQFDFIQAITMPFRSSDGKQFAWRLWFWMSLCVSLLYIVLMPFFLPILGELAVINWENMQEMQNSSKLPSSTKGIEVIKQGWLPFLIYILIFWSIYACSETALNRKLISEQEYPRIPIRFGLLELKVMAAQFSMSFFTFSLYAIAMTLTIVVSAFLVNVSQPLGVAFIVLAFIAIICALIYLMVRLCAAAALTVATGEIRVLSARFVTKYRFWYLFLAYLAILIGGNIVIGIINNMLLLLVTGEAGVTELLSGLSTENPQFTLDAIGERLKQPSIMALGVLCLIAMSAVISLWYLCLMGVGTYAVKWWQADNPEPGFD